MQPLLLRGAVTGHASSTQMAQAAYTLLQRCVVEKGVGGIAADIGGDNHLNVVIADYAPHVRCDRTATPGPPWNSCLAIVADMVATRDRKVFGDKGRDPRVEVKLPSFYKASKFDPSLKFNTDADRWHTEMGTDSVALSDIQSMRGVRLQSRSPESQRVRLGMRFGKPCLRCLLCAFGLRVKVGKHSVWVSTQSECSSRIEGTKRRV